jgi:hypothetical protein
MNSVADWAMWTQFMSCNITSVSSASYAVNVHIRNPGITGRKSIHGTCCVNVELLLQYSTCAPLRLAIGWVYLVTAHYSDSCCVAHLVLDTVAEIIAKITVFVTITVLYQCQRRTVGFYGAQSLHYWEGLQNFFLLLADFSDLSLFPSDLICHCVPSSFLYIVVTFSAICEICVPLLFLLSQCCFHSPNEPNFLTSRERKHRSFISHQ